MFVGDGAGKAEVERFRLEHDLSNVLSLPYQPAETLSMSLSAGDVHVVSLGNRMAGIVHPSKVYAAMAVGRPLLYLGPPSSHVNELLERHRIGWRVAHGDVDGAVTTIRSIMAQAPRARGEMGARARRAIEVELAPDRLCSILCDAVEREFGKLVSRSAYLQLHR